LNPEKKITLLFLLMAVSALYVPAQTNNPPPPGAFDTTGFPQWAKDLRRFEIVAFGSIPFAMFFTNFGMDMYRWSKANGMDFSEEGRRYAPWPLKSAGAELMTSNEYEKVFLVAACVSMGIAFTDLFIVQLKRYKARKKAEALPAGTTIITRTPWPEEQDTNDSNEDAAETDPVTPESLSPEQP
jgi:hypothetical protein